ncbi:MAG: PAS domain S-box protein, partial [Gammaproteobacteria bacterium]|nr:PAS domain S-box protein [Gammaproteobacteria bacterium]
MQAATHTSSQITRATKRIELTGLVIFLGVFMLGNSLLPRTPDIIHGWADLFWTAGALFTALRCFVTARRQTGNEARAWRLFGLACMTWFGGMLVWDYQELVLGRYTPFPSWPDLGYYLFAVLFGAGLVQYRGGGPRVPVTLLELSQFGIFLCCIALVHLVIFATPLQARESTPLLVASALAYPVLYMALLIHGVATLWLRLRGPTRRALGIVVTGIAVHALTNSLYAYALLGRTYEAGNYLDSAWLFGFALIYWGAVQYPDMSTRQDAASEQDVTPPLARLVPVASISVTILVILAFRQNLQPIVYAQMFLPMILLMACIALREWAGNTLEAHQAAAVRRSEAQLRQIFSISPVMTTITRRHDGMFVDVNDAYLETTGYRRDELLGRSSTQLGMWKQPQDRQRMIDQLQAKGSIRGFDQQIRTKSGEIREVLASFAPILIEDEECLLGAALDITARERTAAEMRKLARALEQTADIVMITDRVGRIE